MEKPPKPKAPPPVKLVRETDDDASGMGPVPSKRKLPTSEWNDLQCYGV